MVSLLGVVRSSPGVRALVATAGIGTAVVAAEICVALSRWNVRLCSLEEILEKKYSQPCPFSAFPEGKIGMARWR